MPVKTWGDFEIDFDKCLGRGGMGAVYMGRQISLDRPSAIKILKHDLTSNPEFVKRFQREAALLARLVDNHVVQIFGAGEAEGQHYYAMEYVEGDDYFTMIRKGRKFTPDEVMKVGESVGLALQAAWRHRIIHRDIKPSNILLTKDHQTKVMDFGLAKNPESDLTQSEVIMGTAKYMSPEQATGGDCDIRADLYSLGVVLYELAAGQPPFVGEGATAIMYQHVHKTPRPPREINPAIPVEIEKLILRLMQKEPDARFATPDALIAAIRGIQDGVTPDERSTLYNETIRVGEKTTIKPSTPSESPASGRKSAAALVLTLGAVVLLGGGAYFAFTKMGDPALQAQLPSDAVKAPADPSSNPVPDPAKPPADPSKPEPVEPKTADPAPRPASAEDARRRGIEALGLRQWALAYTLLEEAEKLGAKDVAEQKLQARAGEAIAKAEAEPDEERALLHYEEARKFVDDEPLRMRIRATTFRRWRKSAEKNEGGDWQKAADDWKRAIDYADDTQLADAKDRQGFCAKFAEAVSSRASKNWPRALALYQDLAKNPHGQSVTIELEIRRAETELAAAAEMASKEARKEYDELSEQGRRLMKRASWAEAKALFGRLGDAKYKDCPREPRDAALAELAVALAAPPSMVYVPEGKFTMGGAGRAEDGPPGEASTVAFYIDDHETTVAEYGEFLKALNDFGHTPACPKEEPPNKKHLPLDGEDLKPGDPVTGIDWWDAVAYAAWRKKRLPREREWEKAAGFDPEGRRPYPWGSKYQKDGGRSYLGIDGMGGGVMEWTADWFQKYPWSSAEHSDFGEKRRVVRGGVLLAEDATEQAKATFRHSYLPSTRSRKIGFRCVQDVAEK